MWQQYYMIFIILFTLGTNITLLGLSLYLRKIANVVTYAITFFLCVFQFYVLYSAGFFHVWGWN
jgi:hypothetical protein